MDVIWRPEQDGDVIPALALLMELLRELANAGEELTEAGLPVAHSKAIEERAAGTAARSADFGETVYAAHSAAAVQRFAATDHLRQFAKMFQTAPVPVYSHLCVERSSLETAALSYWFTEPGIGADARVRSASKPRQLLIAGTTQHVRN
jgi:hypothetical protein